MVSIESIVFLLFKYIFVKVIFLFLWGNLPQLIPNKLILLIAYILGCSGASPTLAPCPLCCARAAGRGSPMGSSVLGIGLCSATDWGKGHSGHPPHLPLVLSRLRAREETALHKQSKACMGRAQHLLHREQQTGMGTSGQHICPEPLERPPPPCQGADDRPGPGMGVVLVQSWAYPAHSAPAHRSEVPVLR